MSSNSSKNIGQCKATVNTSENSIERNIFIHLNLTIKEVNCRCPRSLLLTLGKKEYHLNDKLPCINPEWRGLDLPTYVCRLMPSIRFRCWKRLTVLATTTTTVNSWGKCHCLQSGWCYENKNLFFLNLTTWKHYFHKLKSL